MKLCRICKLEYSDNIEFCSRCGAKLEKEQEKWTTPSDYEEEY
ncbi:MAG: hypothetical protein QW818_03645 [Candidatus Aenigmatarchaeota archaeon]